MFSVNRVAKLYAVYAIFYCQTPLAANERVIDAITTRDH